MTVAVVLGGTVLGCFLNEMSSENSPRPTQRTLSYNTFYQEIVFFMAEIGARKKVPNVVLTYRMRPWKDLYNDYL